MKAELVRFVATELLSGRTAFDLQPEDDLLTSELIDSMGVMRLIAYVERKYNVKVPPEDVTIENFLTIDAICDYLSRRDAC